MDDINIHKINSYMVQFLESRKTKSVEELKADLVYMQCLLNKIKSNVSPSNTEMLLVSTICVCKGSISAKS